VGPLWWRYPSSSSSPARKIWPHGAPPGGCAIHCHLVRRQSHAPQHGHRKSTSRRNQSRLGWKPKTPTQRKQRNTPTNHKTKTLLRGPVFSMSTDQSPKSMNNQQTPKSQPSTRQPDGRARGRHRTAGRGGMTRASCLSLCINLQF